MKVDFRELESMLISKVSALFFAFAGVALAAVAYFKYNVPTQTVAPAPAKDTRDLAVIKREKKLENAQGLFEKRLYRAAAELLLELDQELPKNPQILALLSFCEKKLGQLENAEVHLRQAIEVEPGQWIFHNNLGLVLFDKGKADEALDSFKKALELSPKNHQVLLSQGRVLELIGKFTDARLSYGRALEAGGLDEGTSAAIKTRLKKLDVLAFIERGDR